MEKDYQELGLIKIDEETKRMKCQSPNCDGADLSRKDQLRRHFKTAHKMELEKCIICKKYIISQDEHMNIYHKGAKHHNCEKCGKFFKQSGTMQRHMRSCSKIEYECEKCGNIYKKINAFANHLKVCQKVIADAECSKCEMKFKSVKEKSKHIIDIHEEVVAFQCPSCDKQFFLETNLKRHVIQAHKVWRNYASHEKKAKCNFCKKSFRNAFALKIHSTKKHKGKNPKMKCKFCEKLKALNHFCEESMKNSLSTTPFDKIGEKEVKSLEPKKCLLDSVVTTFMTLYASKSDKNVLVLDSGFLTFEYKFNHSLGTSNYFGKIKVQEQEFILAPYCVNHHWCLFKIDMIEFKITSYDSLLVNRKAKLLELKRIMEQHMVNVGLPKIFLIEENKNVFTQSNKFDSGMHVLGYSKQLLGLYTEFSQEYIDKERKILQNQIIEHMKYNFTYEDDSSDSEEN